MALTRPHESDQDSFPVLATQNKHKISGRFRRKFAQQGKQIRVIANSRYAQENDAENAVFGENAEALSEPNRPAD